MQKLVDAILEDHSSRDVFLFRASCGSCGRDCASRPLRFSKAGQIPPNRNRQILFEALYAQEHAAARHAAVRTAAQRMNYCPICRRIVCDLCFLICRELDMCRQCASALQEQGDPVETLPAELGRQD